MTTRFLLHTIDATTYSARRSKNAGWGGMFFVLLVTGAAMTVVMLRYLGYV